MTDNKPALLGISNAIVDILTTVDHDVLATLDVPPGSMTLIDAERAAELLSMMRETRQSAGGSVANSIACFASLGGSATYIGRVADDALGHRFADDMTTLGVGLQLPPETRNAPTARCHVFITPDGERTMQTFLGACTEIAVADITPETIAAPSVALLEGYVWDTPEGPEAMSRAIALSKPTGTRIALSLSDSFCVERHQSAFEDLVHGNADIIIGNEAETIQLFQAEDIDAAIKAAKATGKLWVITRSEKGSVIIEGEYRHDQSADKDAVIEDATGAGDAYVAGFLFGLTAGWPHAQSAELATRCATLAIGQVGARPSSAVLASLTQ